jgi:CheY-like chemotaxis protein
VPDSRRYILHLDDEALILRIVGDALNQRGHEVRSARTVQDLRRLAAQEKPALLLCDLHLPESDGLTAIRELRARWPDVPVVALSGSVSDPLRSPKFAGMFDAFIPKPCSLAFLTQEVEHLLAS